MLMRTPPLVWTFLLLFVCACQGTRGTEIHQAPLGDERAFEALRAAFAANNPGYGLAYHGAVQELRPSGQDRVVFVQGPAERTEAPTVGDVLLVRAGDAWKLEGQGAVDLV